MLPNESVGAPVANNSTAIQVRQLIDRQVGGIDKLRVPLADVDIPVVRQKDGTVSYRYQTTEAKRFLGKHLFHDPSRVNRIDTAFGGSRLTLQSGSCGSCHLGEVSGKAGTQINFNVGGEGRAYIDAKGNFIPRRRARTDILPPLRQKQLFPGDALVDSLPTLTDILAFGDCADGSRQTAELHTPARFHKKPAPCGVLATGRLDAVDSVGRQSPSMIGFAYNNRLLFGGFAGESMSLPGGLNPMNDTAQENLTLLLLDAHRMFTDNPPTPGEQEPGERDANGQSAVLQSIPAYVKLFTDAFPVEAAESAAKNDPNILINDVTVLRATATYLRTAVTRNTPFDKFVRGDNQALTHGQLRGARLFFTPATSGGANCFACHSGPMFNKQYNDPDLAGVGKFVEENFSNVGIGDHPVQALNRAAVLTPNSSRHDTGRQEITGDPKAAFKFRSMTLRQLKEAVTFFHSGSPRFKNVRDVVEYFNAGIPDDKLVAGAAATLDPRFTHPRGKGSPRGLGLTAAQITDLTDFIENGLYDPAFSKYDPSSPTRLFELDPTELTYSKYRPDLAALGAKDGYVLSGLAMNNNDPLSRRDQGLEFLDVTDRVGVVRYKGVRREGRLMQTVKLTNLSDPKVKLPGVVDSSSVIDTHLLVVLKGLAPNVRLANASGVTKGGDPYIRVHLVNGVLEAGESISRRFSFIAPAGQQRVRYELSFLSGQGTP